MGAIAIVQARVGSTRFRNKIMEKVYGEQTVLETVLKRMAMPNPSTKNVDRIVLAIPDTMENDVLENYGRKLGYRVSRGSENDVLKRFTYAALGEGCDTIVRVTSDCPLVDPAIISDMMAMFVSGNFDYVGNTIPGFDFPYPDGFDVEIMSLRTLCHAYHNAKSKYDREHVTSYIYSNPEMFKCGMYPEDFGYKTDIRLSINIPEDLNRIRYIFNNLGDSCSYTEIMKFVRSNDEEIRTIK